MLVFSVLTFVSTTEGSHSVESRNLVGVYINFVWGFEVLTFVRTTRGCVRTTGASDRRRVSSGREIY